MLADHLINLVLVLVLLLVYGGLFVWLRKKGDR